MGGEIVRSFEIFGNRYDITAEFDAYNTERSKEAKSVYSIESRYKNRLNAMKERLSCLLQNALDDLLPVVTQIDSEEAVAFVGFAELRRYETEILPRIGKRMVFKYSKDELITVDEVAKHIYLDAQKHFTNFLNAVQTVEDKQKSDWISREYTRMTRSTAAVGGSIGTGMSGAAGILAANAGMRLFQGLGDMISKSISDSEIKDAKRKVVLIGQKAILDAFDDMSNQVYSYCINTISNEMKREIAKYKCKPFMELSENQISDIKSKAENYHAAFQNGDITLERYISHLVSVLHYFPHNIKLYHELFRISLKSSSVQNQQSILELAQYMGLEEQMDQWLKANGLFHLKMPADQSHNECINTTDIAYPSAQIPAIFQQYAKTVYCMWERPRTLPSGKQAPLRTIGLRPNGTVWVTGDKEGWHLDAEQNWRDIVSVCSLARNMLIGLKSDGTILAQGIKTETQFYKTITSWTDITAISAGESHLLGLRKNKTVAVAFIDGVDTSDGRGNVDDWRNIVAIEAGSYFSVGLRTDGTVVATGNNNGGRCNVAQWKNMSSISCRAITTGLTTEGRIITTCEDNQYGASTSYTGIVSVSSGFDHFLFLRNDGTVEAYGTNEYGECNVSEWRDIVAVAAGYKYSIGVKSDGTLISTGKNEYGECDISGSDKIVGPYSPEAAQVLKAKDEQSAAWKAAGLCPYCGGKLSWLSKKCKTCNRYTG